ncbi:hypothetical protein T492DRAFT_865289, partial [Pavlovales sp. CCMP2436]
MGLATVGARLLKLNEEYDAFNGMQYNDLDENLQAQFREFSLIVPMIPTSMPGDQVFGIYEDINSGGDNLNTQQLRRAVYHDDYMDLIDDLRENRHFLELRGATKRHVKDGLLTIFLNRELQTLEEQASVQRVLAEAYLADNDSKDNSRIRLSDTNKPSVFQGMMRELQVLTDKDATLAQGFVGN